MITVKNGEKDVAAVIERKGEEEKVKMTSGKGKTHRVTKKEIAIARAVSSFRFNL